MLTIIELTAHPLFKEFHLVSSAAGLSNRVTGTGIFDWESPKDIESTFAAGEFVVTTLSSAKTDIHAAEEGLRALIERNVSAIALKTVYFSTLPDEIIQYADAHHVAVFIFSDTFIDDIIYTIKNLLLSADLHQLQAQVVIDLLQTDNDVDAAEILQYAKKINPSLHEYFICALYRPPLPEGQGQKNMSEADNAQLRRCFSRYLYHTFQFTEEEDLVYTILSLPIGLLVILSDQHLGTNLEEKINKLTEALGWKEANLVAAISSTHDHFSLLRTAIFESVYAQFHGLSERKSYARFEDIGVLKLLCPIHHSYWATSFYEKIYYPLSAYDEVHQSNLLETLLTLTKNNGDITTTASQLYQHANTIRYRIEKIKNLLSISDASDSDQQLYLFAKLYEFNEYLTAYEECFGRKSHH